MWQESKKVIFLCIWKLWTCSHRSTCSKSRDAEKSWSSSGTKSTLFLLCFALRVIFCTIFISRKDCSTLYMIQQWFNLVYWNCFLLVLLEYLIGEIKKVPWQLYICNIFTIMLLLFWKIGFKRFFAFCAHLFPLRDYCMQLYFSIPPLGNPIYVILYFIIRPSK